MALFRKYGLRNLWIASYRDPEGQWHPQIEKYMLDDEFGTVYFPAEEGGGQEALDIARRKQELRFGEKARSAKRIAPGLRKSRIWVQGDARVVHKLYGTVPESELPAKVSNYLGITVEDASDLIKHYLMRWRAHFLKETTITDNP